MPRRKKNYAEMMEAFASYVAEERPRVESPEDAAALMRPVLSGREQEEMHVLLLDTKNRMVATERVTVGLLDRTQLHARELFRAAIRANCAKVVLVHNHPSGDPTPSAPDIATTRDLVAAGKVVGIEAIDHVVLGVRTPARAKDYLSFREESLL